MLTALNLGLFALLAAWYAVRVWLADGWVDRCANLLHSAMAMSMVTMSMVAMSSLGMSRVGMSTAAWSKVEIPVFTVGVFFYVGVSVFAADHSGHHPQLLGSRLGLGYHALMMASMVWMSVSMLPAVPLTDAAATQESGSASSSIGGVSPRGGMGSMSGMSSMSHGGHSAMSSASVSGAMMTGDLPWAHAVSVGLGVLFALAACLLLWTLIDHAASATVRPRALGDDIAAVLMAGGMSMSFLILMR